MGWKHFYLRNPLAKNDSYCVNSYGALDSIMNHSTKKRQAYETIWLNYGEVERILSLKTKQEKYYLCDKLFKQKFPQSEKDKKELSKDEQSKLEKLFP